MILAALAFSAMAAGVKFCRRLPPLEIVFFRSVFGVAVMLIYMPIKRASFAGSSRLSLLIRGAAGTLAVCLHFFALIRLPLGTGVLLNCTAPIFVVVLAAIFLREKVRRYFLASTDRLAIKWYSSALFPAASLRNCGLSSRPLSSA